MNEELNNTNETEGADFTPAPIATSMCLYMNAGKDHGIIQLVDAGEDVDITKLTPHGSHVLAQLAFTPDQLRAVAAQLLGLVDELGAGTDGP